MTFLTYGTYTDAKYPARFEDFFALLADKYKTVIFSARTSRWSKDHVGTFSRLLSKNTHLKVLDLSNNNLGDVGLKLLFQALCQNRTLELLDLTNNKLNEDSGFCLAQTVLVKNSSIASLYLEKNYMGVNTWLAISRSLKTNKTITDLNCAENGLTDRSIEALAAALKYNTALTTLSLRENRFGDKGALAILDALQVNITLSTLWMRSNDVGEGVERAIYSKIDENEERQREAFYETLESDKKGPWHRSRLMVIGEGNVGKTATIRSLLNLPFDSEWNSTIGICLTEARAQKKGEWVGNAVSSLPSVDYLTNFAARITLDTLDEELEEEKEISRKRGSILSLFEEESDSDDSEVMEVHTDIDTTSNAEENAQLFRRKEKDREFDKMLLIDARNKKDSINISIWDYGGQTVFYTMHHLFLTSYGVYLLCFDMYSLLNQPESATEYLKFWLNSVKMHASSAPVLVVGTFLDKVQENLDLERVNRLVSEVVKSYPQVVADDTSSLNFFPIDNSTKTGMLELRNKVDTVTRAQEFVYSEVSMRWMRCLESILAVKDSPWLSLANVHSRAKGFEIISMNEVVEMLSLFHKLGVVVHFTSTEILRGTVTTNPQWLVDAISKVIRDDRIHRFDLEKINALGLKNDIRDLFVEGVASRDLLEYLWESRQVEFLLDLMRQLLLLSKWDYGNQEAYLIPSMIVKVPKRGFEHEGLRLEVDFRSFFLPNGVFERLVCLCLSHSSLIQDSPEPILRVNHAEVHFGMATRITMKKEKESINVWIQLQKDAPYCLDLISACMRKIKADVMGSEFSYNILVKTDRGMLSVSEARRHSSDWFGASPLRTKSFSNLNINSLF